MLSSFKKKVISVLGSFIDETLYTVYYGVLGSFINETLYIVYCIKKLHCVLLST
jgi:hypothetical protein